MPTSGPLLTILIDHASPGAALSLRRYLLGFATDVIGRYFHSSEIWRTSAAVSPACVRYLAFEYQCVCTSIGFWCVPTQLAVCAPTLMLRFSFVLFVVVMRITPHFIISTVRSQERLWARMHEPWAIVHKWWKRTVREKPIHNFWIEVLKVLKRSWLLLVIATLCVIAVFVLSTMLVPPR